MTDDLIFVGFNSRVAALRRDTDAVIWDWRACRAGRVRDGAVDRREDATGNTARRNVFCWQ